MEKISMEYSTKMKMLEEKIKEIGAMGGNIEEYQKLFFSIKEKTQLVLQRHSLEEQDFIYENSILECNTLYNSLSSIYPFYSKIYNKYQRLKNRMFHLRKEQIQSTGIELIMLLQEIAKKKDVLFLENSIVEDISSLLYECMQLEVCYDGTIMLFSLVKKEDTIFLFFETILKREIEKEAFEIQEFNEEFMYSLGEKKAKALKVEYMEKLHSYEKLKRKNNAHEKSATVLKIKNIRKRKYKIWFQQLKYGLFGFLCLAVVNLSGFGIVSKTQEDLVILEEQEEKDFFSVMGDFASNHPLFCSGIIGFDLLTLYIFYKKMHSGSLGSEFLELQKLSYEMEKALVLEEKEKRKMQERLVEWQAELIKKYEFFPDNIKKDPELLSRMRLLKNKE